MTDYKLTINDQTFDIAIGAIEGGIVQVLVNQVPYEVRIDSSGRPVTASPAPAGVAAPTASGTGVMPAPKAATPGLCGAGEVAAPIPGKILHLKVKVGERVKSGQTVAIMEAMKMENDILSPMAGTVKEIRAAVGADVATGDVIMVIG